MESRNQVFHKLKPPCVALSHAALALQGSRGSVQNVTERLEDLKHILSITSIPDALDQKLADYCFFPLSQILKTSQKVSLRCLELSLQCLAILIDRGWRQNIQAKLAAQIVILCTLMAEKKPNGFSFDETTNELRAAAFWCLYHLFLAAGHSRDTREALTSEANFPQLGQTISVMLEALHDNDAPEVQIATIVALEALVLRVADRELCANFLPGIVSRLTRVLAPSTKQRLSYKVLIGGLNIIAYMLKMTLSEGCVSTMLSTRQTARSMINEEWKQNAALQLKPALSPILRLKSHSRSDVIAAVAELCLVLLEHCREDLNNCSPLALETMIIIFAERSGDDIMLKLRRLVRHDPSISSLLQSTMYDWLQSMPTTMLSSDEQAKVQKIQQIRTTYELMIDSGSDTTTTNRILAASLRDSVVLALQEPEGHRQASSLAAHVPSLDLTVLSDARGNAEFSLLFVKRRGQEEVMKNVEALVHLISNSASSSAFMTDIARTLRMSQGDAQAVNFWILLTSIQAALQRRDTVVDLMETDGNVDSQCTEYLEELYFFSLSILTRSAEDASDPRLQALALRGLALRAQTAGQDFRYELIDALYPVLHSLATPDELLQKDSIITLKVFTEACGYGSVRDLIVENVDYLTNAVALKLNAFDVSPQAPQVLLMMVKLAGPNLLPYLEDTVESIFAALEDYHGYPLLVELLFKVLGVMAEQGVRAPQLGITEGPRNEVATYLREKWQPTSMEALVELLRDRVSEEAKASEAEAMMTTSHPQRPWKGTEDLGDDDAEKGEGRDDGQALGHDEQTMDIEDPAPPAPKTYNLLLKIAQLTQHFLPSASPSLRVSLLTLIRTTVPAIATHENSFLPLINTLWPEVVYRLEDSEPHIQATALAVVDILCEHAGDFMRSRILQLWPAVVEMHEKTMKDVIDINRSGNVQMLGQEQSKTALMPAGQQHKQAVPRMRGSPTGYTNTSLRLMWNALLGMLVTVAQNVPLSPEIFDEALEMLQPVLESEQVRSALDQKNADAVWLARLRTGAIDLPSTLTRPTGSGWQFAEVPG